jgi:hypothetical protein
MQLHLSNTPQVGKWLSLSGTYLSSAHAVEQPHSDGEGIDAWGSVPKGISGSSPDCLPGEVMV